MILGIAPARSAGRMTACHRVVCCEGCCDRTGRPVDKTAEVARLVFRRRVLGRRFWRNCFPARTLRSCTANFSTTPAARSPRSAFRATISRATGSEAQKNGLQEFRDHARVAPQLADELEQNHVRFSGQRQNTFVSTLLPDVPTLMFFGIWYFWREAQSQGGVGGLMSIGRSKSEGLCRDRHQDDVQGRLGVTSQGGTRGSRRVSEASRRIRSQRECRRHPAGRAAGHRQDSARAVAGEAGVPFFSINGSEFVEMFVARRGARSVRAGARECASDHFHRRTRRDGPRLRLLYPYTTRRSRRSINCWFQNSTASRAAAAPPTGRKSSIPRAAARRMPFRPPGASGPARQARADRDRESLSERASARRRRLGAEDRRRPGLPARTSRTSSTRRPSSRLGASEEIGMNDFTEAVERIIAGLEKKKRVLTPKERASRRLPRDGPRFGGDVVAERRTRAQDFHHPARRRRARLHLQRAIVSTATNSWTRWSLAAALPNGWSSSNCRQARRRAIRN